mmetsp:Transcript_10705/g.19640  ORF Transcript_10705/g.19640 Transcript_10705/m.19640 type:complete len:149 (+) Transcript_10705:924-1370(+)
MYARNTTVIALLHLTLKEISTLASIANTSSRSFALRMIGTFFVCKAAPAKKIPLKGVLVQRELRGTSVNSLLTTLQMTSLRMTTTTTTTTAGGGMKDPSGIGSSSNCNSNSTLSSSYCRTSLLTSNTSPMSSFRSSSSSDSGTCMKLS